LQVNQVGFEFSQNVNYVWLLLSNCIPTNREMSSHKGSLRGDFCRHFVPPCTRHDRRAWGAGRGVWRLRLESNGFLRRVREWRMVTRTVCGGEINPALPEKQNRRHGNNGILSCRAQSRQCFSAGTESRHPHGKAGSVFHPFGRVGENYRANGPFLSIECLLVI